MVMHYFCISRLWGEVINEQNEICVVLMGCDKNFLQGAKDKGFDVFVSPFCEPQI